MHSSKCSRSFPAYFCSSSNFFVCFWLFIRCFSESAAHTSHHTESATLRRLFFDWTNFRNGTDYSPLAPANPDCLPPLTLEQMASDGLDLSPNGTTANLPFKLSSSRRMLKNRHRVEADSPFAHRAICPFKFVLNRRRNRIPETLVEVKCLSSSPVRHFLGRSQPMVECEPMRWTLRVLECQPGIDGRRICWKARERIATACVPVLQASREEARQLEDVEGEDEEEEEDRVQFVPAAPIDEEQVPV